MFDDSRSDPAPGPVRRVCHQRPMLRQTLTMCVPWEDGDDFTLELIGLPSGHGTCYEPLAGETTRSPIDEDELHVLREAGWEEFQAAGMTLWVRFIR